MERETRVAEGGQNPGGEAGGLCSGAPGALKEWVVLTGLWAVLAFPAFHAPWPVQALVFVLTSLVLVVALATVSAGTARLKVAQIARFYWLWGLGVAVIALVAALVRL